MIWTQNTLAHAWRRTAGGWCSRRARARGQTHTGSRHHRRGRSTVPRRPHATAQSALAAVRVRRAAPLTSEGGFAGQGAAAVPIGINATAPIRRAAHVLDHAGVCLPTMVVFDQKIAGRVRWPATRWHAAAPAPTLPQVRQGCCPARSHRPHRDSCYSGLTTDPVIVDADPALAAFCTHCSRRGARRIRTRRLGQQ